MKKDRVRDKFLKTLGEQPIVSVACRKNNVSRNSVYRWRKEDPEFRKEMNRVMAEGENFICDMAESQIIKKISEGHFPSAIFYLRHHRRKYLAPEWRALRTLGKLEEKGLAEMLKEGLRRNEMKKKSEISNMENQYNSPDYPDDNASDDSTFGGLPSKNHSSELPKSHSENKKDKNDTSRPANIKRGKGSAGKT